MTKFFHFNQNNSGGSFVFEERGGITHHVVIEARDAADANALAESKGIYFHGCSDGRDCSCCGDRWSSVWSGDKGTDVPSIYDEPLGQLKKPSKWGARGWMKEGHETAVHYLDGRIEWFGADNLPAKATGATS